MKKLFTLLMLGGLAISAKAQTVPGGDMETWRTYMSDTAHLTAPDGWNGSDSIAYGVASQFGGLISITPKKQIFQSTSSHGGTYAAELVTRSLGNFLGIFPALLTNGNISVDVINQTFSMSGGSPVNMHITHVNAYATYTTPGIDSGAIQVQAIKYINGMDSVVGVGLVTIPPTANYTMFTASINYVNGTIVPDTILISFASSNSQTAGVDSSILNIDDVSMDTVGLGVHNQVLNNGVSIYPNPTTGILHISAPQYAGLTCTISNAAGAAVLQKFVSGTNVIDMSAFPSGMYFYTITDRDGAAVQKGKFSLTK
jgi:hypothetical protein